MASQPNRWKRTRVMGCVRFVLLYGAGAVGLSGGILFSIAFWFITREAPFLNILVVSLILFPVGGVVWGLCMWFLNEAAYAKIVEQERMRVELDYVLDEVSHLRERLPPSKDTNITDQPG